MVILLVLGTIFTLGGVGIYYLGQKRGVPNSLLWGLFSVFHGLHEYADHFIDEVSDPIFIERVEVLFAVLSTIMLLAACIEFLGVVNHPNGKLVGVFMTLVISYVVFFTSNEAFETLEDSSFDFTVLSSSFFRFFFGFVLVMASMLVIILSFLYLQRTGREVGKDLTNSTILSVVLLAIFSFFEGFESSNDLFVLLRGFSGLFFLLIPVVFIIFSKPGLTNLILFDAESGRFISGYDFGQQKDIAAETEWINTAGFLSAIMSFSKAETTLGEVRDINTEAGTYIITPVVEGIHLGLQVRLSNSQLKASLTDFTAELKVHIPSIDTNALQFEEFEPFVELVEKYFSNYY